MTYRELLPAWLGQRGVQLYLDSDVGVAWASLGLDLFGRQVRLEREGSTQWARLRLIGKLREVAIEWQVYDARALDDFGAHAPLDYKLEIVPPVEHEVAP